MIALIKGKLISISSSYAIVDTHGIGYQVFIPLSSYYPLCEQRENDISLHIYTYVREDALTLFGFLTKKEKALFERLISVSSIGPKLAINILSGISVDELINAVKANNISALKSIPGVGKKTAERMILELKDKVCKISAYISDTETAKSINYSDKIYQDALSALTNLGYNKIKAEAALKKIIKNKGSISFEEIIKNSLQEMSNA